MLALRPPALAGALFLCFTAGALAQTAPITGSTYFGLHENGWWWYETAPAEDAVLERETVPPPPAAPPTVEEKKPVAAGKPGPKPGSSAWLRENLPRLRDEALDHPEDPSYTRTYLLAQKLSVNKATGFAENARRVTMADPDLDETRYRPFVTAGANEANTMAGRERDKALKALGQSAGIWFFYRADCSQCELQAPVLEALERTYGIAVRPIALDGKPLANGLWETSYQVDKGQGKALGVRVTPTLVLAHPPQGVAMLSEGTLGFDELRQRLLMVATVRGWLPEAILEQTRTAHFPKKAGDGAETDDSDREISRSPATTADFLRQKVREWR